MRLDHSIAVARAASPEMRAVLMIFEYDEELRGKARPFVDTVRESIDWERILSQDFGGGHSAAILWARAIWCDQIETAGDLFDRAFAMSTGLQTIVIKALGVRWGCFR